MLYVRQVAWLHAVPERAEGDKSGAPLESRLATLRKVWAVSARGRDPDDYEPELPPVAAGEHLIGYLFEIGPADYGGAGAAVIRYAEIAAASALLGLRLAPWEVRTLRRLSAAYVSELHKAEKRDRQPPWRPDNAPPQATPLQNRLRALAQL